MEKYRLLRKVREGSKGTVWAAVDTTFGVLVTIKRVKLTVDYRESCSKSRELKALITMRHPNIVQVRDVIREGEILYLVFDRVDSNLYLEMRKRGGDCRFSEEEIKNLCFQVFQGLTYMHRRGYYHRNLKPENLLVSGDKIQIGSLGTVREILSGPPLTERAGNLCYRAPEVLLRSEYYSFKVDMWAMGAIMAEMFLFRRIFSGGNEIDQINKICNVIGTPTMESWPGGIFLARAWNFKFHEFGATNTLPCLLQSSASVEAIDLIERLCSWNPTKRPVAADALRHPFFKSCYGNYKLTPCFEKLRLGPSSPKFPMTASAAYGDCSKNAGMVSIGAPIHYPKRVDETVRPVTKLNRLVYSRSIPWKINCPKDVRVTALEVEPQCHKKSRDETGKPVNENRYFSTKVFSSETFENFLLGKTEEVPEANDKDELSGIESDEFYRELEKRITESLWDD